MRRWLAMVMAMLVWSTQALAGNDDIAVIIGNANYRGAGAPPVKYAHRDAEAMLRLIRDGLGYRAENIIDLRDATLSQFVDLFGNERSAEGRIFDWAKPGKSNITIFYSGHGMPDVKEKRAYLLPTDASPDNPQLSGYPLDLLLDNLAKVPAKSVTVYLDACFSGVSPEGALVKNVSAFGTALVPPPKPKPGITVVTAAGPDQYANWDDQAGHGLFTEYLLRAFYANSTVTAKSLKAYLDEDMTYAARRNNRRTQTADVRGNEGVVLVAWPGGRVPTRPDLGGVRMAAVAPAPSPPPPVVTPVQPAAVPRLQSPLQSRTPGTVFRDCPDCPEMVVIPAGSFMMGSAEKYQWNEHVVHQVTISRPFAVGKYEVTQAEWEMVMGSNPSEFKDLRNPVENVRWTDVKDFVLRLNAKVRSVVQVSTGEDGPYRLLTEAEWEYAARAGTTTKYWWGDTVGSGNANCRDCSSQWSGKKTSPVGSFPPNTFGLYDMHGNVSEWVEDCYVKTYADAPANGNPVSRSACNRVHRGGNWEYASDDMRSAKREVFPGDSRTRYLGFRLARTLP